MPMRDSSFRTQVRRAWTRLRGGELTAPRAFWSVAIGVFVGVQPTPGLHLPVVLAICIPLRLDTALSYCATNISIPPVAPLLWFVAIQIGERALTGRFAPLTVGGVRELVRAPGLLLGALALGSIVLGVLLGTAAGAMAYVIARRRTSGRPEEPRPRS